MSQTAFLSFGIAKVGTIFKLPNIFFKKLLNLYLCNNLSQNQVLVPKTADYGYRSSVKDGQGTDS